MAQEVEDPCGYGAFLTDDMHRLSSPDYFGDADAKKITEHNIEEEIQVHTNSHWSIFFDDERTRQNLRIVPHIVERLFDGSPFAFIYAAASAHVLEILEKAGPPQTERLVGDILEKAPRLKRSIELIDGVLNVDGVAKPIKKPVLNVTEFQRQQRQFRGIKKHSA